MPALTTAFRRIVVLLMLAAVTGAAIAWWRDRRAVDLGDPPVWPELPDLRVVPASPAPAPAVVSPETPTEATWRPTTDNGSPPEGYPVKVKESSGIIHVPGGRFYDRTKADRCYPSAAAAEADGYRRSKS
jgi:hypothetical protein